MAERKIETGHAALRALGMALAHRGAATNAEALVREHPEIRDDGLDWEVLGRCARPYRFRAELLHPTPEELKEVPLPAVIRFKNGRFAMLGVNSDEVVFFLDPDTGKAMAMPSSEFREVWSGEVLALRERFSWQKVVRHYSLDWFGSVILHYKKYLAEIFLASLFLQAMGILMPLFTQVIVDKVIGNGGLSTLTVLGIAMLVLAVVQSVLGFLRTYVMNTTTTKLDAVLGTRLFRHLISLPVPYYEHRRVGDTMMRVNSLAGIRQFMTGDTITVVLNALFSVVFVAMMLYYSVKLTLVSLVVIPLFAVQAVLVYPWYQKKIEEVWRAGSIRQSFLIEAITGMQTVKSLAVEPQFLKKWEKYLSRYVSAAFGMAKFNLSINTVNQLLSAVSTLAVLWVGGYMVMENRFTLGQLIAFQMLAAQAIGPLIQLFTMWPQVQQMILGLDRIGDILHARMEPVLLPSPAGLRVLQGDIELRDVTFRYRLDLPPAVDHVSLHIRPGEKIGIVGRSGSGKSTLAALIEKIYFPTEGSIFIDGTNLAEADYNWLRQQMGVVMQDNYLFDGSIRDNIAAARPAASMGEVMQAAQLAGAHEFILELDEGYDTRVGERGAGLSGGQRQRIAIARALLTNPRVLIFDEATSALDYESERLVMRNIEAIGKDRTMLIIAHRLVTVAHCDRIFVLDQGHLVEQGSPAELLARDGIYRKLYEQQEVAK